MECSFLYLDVIVDWTSRQVIAWWVNTTDAEFCVEALKEALPCFGRPEIFDTDQGSQFTSGDFTGVLRDDGCGSASTGADAGWTACSSNGSGRR